jgi:hypothetical protein
MRGMAPFININKILLKLSSKRDVCKKMNMFLKLYLNDLNHYNKKMLVGGYKIKIKSNPMSCMSSTYGLLGSDFG